MKRMKLLLTGQISETLRLVVATSLSGSCASFSLTLELNNKNYIKLIILENNAKWWKTMQNDALKHLICKTI